MPTVDGVLGPIDTDELGFTLMHEHILVANSAMRQAFARWVDVDEVVRFATEEARAAAEHVVVMIFSFRFWKARLIASRCPGNGRRASTCPQK